jgi:hypothetical protein
MACATTSISSRIAWCRQQSTQAHAPLELEGWHAEEEGLHDALFNRDHTDQYRRGPTTVFVRYLMGLQDGQAMIRTAGVVRRFPTPAQRHL